MKKSEKVDKVDKESAAAASRRGFAKKVYSTPQSGIKDDCRVEQAKKIWQKK